MKGVQKKICIPKRGPKMKFVPPDKIPSSGLALVLISPQCRLGWVGLWTVSSLRLLGGCNAEVKFQLGTFQLATSSKVKCAFCLPWVQSLKVLFWRCWKATVKIDHTGIDGPKVGWFHLFVWVKCIFCMQKVFAPVASILSSKAKNDCLKTPRELSILIDSGGLEWISDPTQYKTASWVCLLMPKIVLYWVCAVIFL